MTHEVTRSQLQPGQSHSCRRCPAQKRLWRDKWTGPGRPSPAQAQATLQHTVVPVGLRLQEWHPSFPNESNAPQVQELGLLPLTSLVTQMQNYGQGPWALSQTLEEAVMRTSIWQGRRRSTQKVQALHGSPTTSKITWSPLILTTQRPET